MTQKLENQDFFEGLNKILVQFGIQKIMQYFMLYIRRKKEVQLKVHKGIVLNMDYQSQKTVQFVLWKRLPIKGCMLYGRLQFAFSYDYVITSVSLSLNKGYFIRM